jgi:hypothetical protein
LPLFPFFASFALFKRPPPFPATISFFGPNFRLPNSPIPFPGPDASARTHNQEGRPFWDWQKMNDAAGGNPRKIAGNGKEEGEYYKEYLFFI